MICSGGKYLSFAAYFLYLARQFLIDLKSASVTKKDPSQDPAFYIEIGPGRQN
jgi:hypothetical protein